MASLFLEFSLAGNWAMPAVKESKHTAGWEHWGPLLTEHRTAASRRQQAVFRPVACRFVPQRLAVPTACCHILIGCTGLMRRDSR